MQRKSISSCFFEFRQTRIKSLCQQDFKDTVMLAKKQFRKNLNAIRKRMRFSFSSMFDQVKIISYFKSVDKSNFTSIKSIKFSTFINCFNSTSRFCLSINRTTKTSQYRRIAIDETFDLKIQQKIKNCFSFRFFEQEYIVVADVDYINKDIRVKTSLTNARKYNSIKSSIKSTEKLKFNIFSSKFNSTFRFRSSVNQDARISHIDFTSCRLFKFFKFVVFINSLNSTFRFSLSINHDSVMSQMLISMSSRINFLRALINQQVVYVSITRFSVAFRQRYLVSSTHSHRHLDIRVETTLKKKER